MIDVSYLFSFAPGDDLSRLLLGVFSCTGAIFALLLHPLEMDPVSNGCFMYAITSTTHFICRGFEYTVHTKN